MAAVPAGRAERIERPAAPESDATQSLFERFSGQIFGYCLHQLGSREEAEDAVQTTFMNAFRGLQRGIVPKVESAWLFKIAHNVCLSRRRSTRRRGRVEAPNNFEVLQEVVPARERSGDELIRLQDVLEEMPETQRRAILLREWQGLSYREIAEELDVSQSAVETLIFRARRALASGLEVEPARWRRRARHGFDAGTIVAALKGLVSVGTAAKVAATIAVATTAAVAVSGTGHRHVRSRPHVRVTNAVRVHHASVAPSVASVRVLTRSPARHVVVSPSRHRVVVAPRIRMPQPPAPGTTARASVRATRPVTASPHAADAPAESHGSGVAKSPAPLHDGLAKGHEKPAKAQPAPPPAQPAAPVTDPVQQEQPPHVADPQGGGEHGNGNTNGGGNGHGHG